MSSLVGAVFGAFILALFIPVVRPLVLSFGSPELFMLAILGLTFVSSLSGEAIVKGLLGAGIGLFLATIGLDPQTGIQTFHLRAGLPLGRGRPGAHHHGFFRHP